MFRAQHPSCLHSGRWWRIECCIKARLFLGSQKETNTTELGDNPEGMGFQWKWHQLSRPLGAIDHLPLTETGKDYCPRVLGSLRFCIKSNSFLLMKYFMMGVVNYCKETFWSARIYDDDKFGQCLFKCLYEWTLPKFPQVLLTGSLLVIIFVHLKWLLLLRFLRIRLMIYLDDILTASHTNYIFLSYVSESIFLLSAFGVQWISKSSLVFLPHHWTFLSFVSYQNSCKKVLEKKRSRDIYGYHGVLTGRYNKWWKPACNFHTWKKKKKKMTEPDPSWWWIPLVNGGSLKYLDFKSVYSVALISNSSMKESVHVTLKLIFTLSFEKGTDKSVWISQGPLSVSSLGMFTTGKAIKSQATWDFPRRRWVIHDSFRGKHLSLLGAGGGKKQNSRSISSFIYCSLPHPLCEPSPFSLRVLTAS